MNRIVTMNDVKAGLLDEPLALLVQPHPELYDTKHENYHNRNLKRRLWNEICDVLSCPGTTGDDVVKRWQYLRERYGRERRKYIPSGSGADAIPPAWPMLGVLAFLEPHMLNRGTSSNMAHSDSVAEPTVHQASNMAHSDSVAEPTVHQEDPANVQSPNSKPGTPCRKKMKHNTSSVQNQISQSLALIAKQDETAEQQLDGDELFMMAMAKELKGIELKRRRELKLKIYSLILEYC